MEKDKQGVLEGQGEAFPAFLHVGSDDGSSLQIKKLKKIKKRLAKCKIILYNTKM